MAKSYRVNINLNGLQLLNAAMQPSASAPSAISAGQIYYNTSGNLYFSTASGTGNWVQLATGSTALASLNGLTVATTLQGTSNQITVTTSSPNITLSFPTGGVTLPGKTTLTASSTSAASLNIPSGTAPSAPVSGDIWLVGATGIQSYYGGTPATHTLADLDSTQTFTNKTLTTPTINGASLSGTFSGAHTISGVATFSASPVIATITNTGTLTLPTSTDTLVGRATTDTFTNKTFDTAGTGNVFKVNGTQISSTTGSGSQVVLSNSPSLTTPAIGTAGFTLAGSVSGTITIAPATGTVSGTITVPSVATTDTFALLSATQALTNKTVNGLTISTSTGTLTIANGSSLVTSGANSITLTSTGATNVTLPTSGTLVNTAVTSLSSLTTIGTGTGIVYSTSGVLTTYTTSGTGTVVALATSPSFTTPTLGAATATSINGLTISSSTGTLTIPNSTTLAISGANNVTIAGASGGSSVTLPSSGTLVSTTVTSLPSLGTVNTSLNGYVSAASGVLSASSTIPGSAVSGNISGNAANVTGIVALANGGTNTNITATQGGIAYGTSSGITLSSAGTSGYVLTSAGTSAPTWTQSTATNVNSAVVQRDSSGNIAVSQVTVSADPTSALQVATKQYVDNLAAGYNQHEAVIAATTTDLTTLGTWGTVTYTAGSAGADGGTGVGATLTPANNGILVIDNVSPVATDRVLIKNQSTATQNGIYVVTSPGSAGSKWTLTRATDYDNHVAGEVSAGDLTLIVAPASEFSVTPTNQNSAWAENGVGTGTNKQIKIGTDNITFAQFYGGSTVTAGAGTSVTGNQVSIALGSAFDTTTGTGTSGLSLTGNTLQLRLNSNGGLTSTTAGLAVNPGTGLSLSGNQLVYSSGTTTQTGSGITGGAYSYATQKQVATITGNGSLTSFAVNHNLNSQDIMVQVYQTSSTPDTQYSEVEVDIVRTSTSVVTVSFAAAPASGAIYNVVMAG